MSRQFSASTFINAPAADVWAVLTDAAGYPEWDPTCLRIEGTIGPGAVLRIYSKLNPRRPFKVRVSEFRPPESMVWTGGMPVGLFKGERTFMLRSEDGRTTHFFMREAFGGRALPIMSRTVPDLTDAFQAFARALKRRVEEGGAD